MQMIKEDPGHQPEEGQTSCAATAAEAMAMRADAAVLLLFGAGQALMAMAAFAVAGANPVGTLLALLLSIPMAERAIAIFPGVLLVAIGRCHDHGFYHQLRIAGDVIITVPFVLLSIAAVVVVFCGKADA
jgi:hypothetical protein